MGLFDAIAGQVAGALGGQSGAGNHAALIQAAMSLINSPQIGGIQGLIAKFQQGGLGEVVASWLGSGQNLPISGDQIKAVFGAEQIGGVAQEVGMSSQEVSSGLAGLLPQLIDQLSPDGKAPEGDALQAAMGMLGGLLKS
ncbi:YidB family protein [Methyloversatilis sp.]|uniref:YidB family protein n=1 Tax=Methyloversatilis sp. TaxID=2569862 RepID=UPI0035AE3309